MSHKEPRMRGIMQKTNRNPKIKRDYTNLPPEIIMDILLRLPIESILSCKCVCKSWVSLVESPEFVKLHLSKPALGLLVFQGVGRSKPYKILEFADEIGPQNYAYYCRVVLRFVFPYYAQVHSSVNGLVLMYYPDLWRPHKLFVCNPVTRDYFELPHPCPDGQCYCCSFGFGVSKMTGQYKIVLIYRVSSEFTLTDGKIYTLGTRSWRSIEHCSSLRYAGHIAPFLNGNLHWLAHDSKGCPLISCFDLETEVFSTLASPPNRRAHPENCSLSVLGDCLCLCDGSVVIDVWLLKDYVDEKSWVKTFIIKTTSDILGGFRFPVKVFEDDEIMVVEDDSPRVLGYSNKTRTLRTIDPYFTSSRTSTVLYAPSFLSVRKMFLMENVRSW